jgi:hypothetical protein
VHARYTVILKFPVHARYTQISIGDRKKHTDFFGLLTLDYFGLLWTTLDYVGLLWTTDFGLLTLDY